MFKYIKAVFRGAYKILFAYPKICKYAKHKDKYSIEERYAYARKLINIVFRAMDVEVEAEGLEKLNKDETYYFVSNHQGFVDPLAMIYLFDKPKVFVSKIEAEKYPFAGKVNKSIDSIFIDRDNIRDAVRMVKQSREYLNNGRDVVIFPEGTRTRDDNHIPGEYKAGALKPAFETKTKIAVLAMDGSYKTFSRKFKGKTIIKVKVLEVIDPSEYDSKNTNDLAKKIEEETKEQILDFRKQ